MRVSSLLVPGALLFTASVVRAQSDLERATARDAASSGRAAFDAGQYEKAIDSFTRAESLVHAPPHLLFLARSQVRLGRLVAAHETYLKITRETLKPSAPKAFSDAQSAAQQELPAVDARLPYVTLTLQGAPADEVTVQMDSITLPAAMIGIPIPADPGRHTFNARGTATGDPVTITLAEGGKQTVVIHLHSGDPAVTSARGTALPTSGGSHSAQEEPVPEVSSQSSGLRVASYVSFGVSVLGIGLGAYFLHQSTSTRGDANELYRQCHAVSAIGNCGTLREQFESKDNDADSQRTFGVAGLVAGGVGMAAGITFMILDLGLATKPPRTPPRMFPTVGIDTLGLAGTF